MSKRISIIITHPEIAKTFNKEINKEKIGNLSQGSDKKVWWKCSKGHLWDASVANRIKQGCAYCAGKRTEYKKSIKYLFPNLIKEWDYKKNKLDPTKTPRGSGKKAWWLCKNGHEWEAVIQSRTGGNGCPYCSGFKASKEHNFEISFQKTALEWHYQKNKLKPSQVTPNSNKKVWWICKNHHEWQSTIAHRAEGLGCPYCSGRYATKESNLKILYANLMKEWDFDLNKEIKPEKLRPGSAKKAWWKCKHGHSWKTAVSNRTGTRKTGCPHCTLQTSSPQIRLIAELRRVFKNISDRNKINGIEMDISFQLKSHEKIAIEYDGSYYHKNSQKRDLKKNKELSKLGVKLFRIREKPLNLLSKRDILVNLELKHSDIVNILEKIKKEVNLKKSELKLINKYNLSKDFIAKREYALRLAQLPGPEPKDSLKYLYPKLSKEWNKEKNHGLKPKDFAPGSSQKVWWKCKNGHEWETRIRYRAIQGSGCQYCATAKGARKATSETCLAKIYPKVATEWDYAKNKLIKIDTILPSSGKKIWWKCINGHSWKVAVYQRTGKKGSKCPYCIGSKASKENNLSITNSELIKEWNNNKNKKKPEGYLAGSNKKVWWICNKGHEWKSIVVSRTRLKNPSGCPYCSNRKTTNENSFFNLFPDLMKEWDDNTNKNIDPKKLTPGSSKKVNWICKKCGHKWKAPILNRTGRNTRKIKSGCLKCSYPRI
jgi:hypothetical protein|tara:strand:+ start:150 stop:2285 length:2136 start_codon:yes stop_codon:yes gene_type:complete